jgi:diacylglycerol O-acyltransferase / wax synthase
MARAHYERLTQESARFLADESSRAFAHSGELLVFEPGPLARPEHGVDFEAIRRGVEASLARVPRARQKLRWIPFENHPIWVDDPDFNLEYHLRHTSLPRPGSEEQLRRMVARIHAQRLDRSRPLWECWVLEGLERGRFALLWKTHLCAVDAASGDDLPGVLLTPDSAAPERSAASFRPRPVPSPFELVRDEVVRQARLPRRTLARVETFLRQPDWRHEVERRVRGLAKGLGYSVRPRTNTPLSGPSGPHRRFARGVVPLEAARRAHRALDAPVHDVLLAVLTGAVRRFFADRLVNPATVDFRVSTPVSLDRESVDEAVGEWIVELPIWEKDPAERVARIRAQTAALQSESPALDARTLAETSRWTGSRRLALGARAVSPRLPVDLTLVNLPGPQQPLYFCGARLIEAFGLTPLREDQALAVAVTSYDGKLCWGLNADFDRLPDLDRFAAALTEAFEETVRLAEQRPRLGVVGGSA